MHPTCWPSSDCTQCVYRFLIALKEEATKCFTSYPLWWRSLTHSVWKSSKKVAFYAIEWVNFGISKPNSSTLKASLAARTRCKKWDFFLWFSNTALLGHKSLPLCSNALWVLSVTVGRRATVWHDISGAQVLDDALFFGLRHRQLQSKDACQKQNFHDYCPSHRRSHGRTWSWGGSACNWTNLSVRVSVSSRRHAW